MDRVCTGRQLRGDFCVRLYVHYCCCNSAAAADRWQQLSTSFSLCSPLNLFAGIIICHLRGRGDKERWRLLSVQSASASLKDGTAASRERCPESSSTLFPPPPFDCLFCTTISLLYSFVFLSSLLQFCCSGNRSPRSDYVSDIVIGGWSCSLLCKCVWTQAIQSIGVFFCTLQWTEENQGAKRPFLCSQDYNAVWLLLLLLLLENLALASIGYSLVRSHLQRKGERMTGAYDANKCDANARANVHFFLFCLCGFSPLSATWRWRNKRSRQLEQQQQQSMILTFCVCTA